MSNLTNNRTKCVHRLQMVPDPCRWFVEGSYFFPPLCLHGGDGNVALSLNNTKERNNTCLPGQFTSLFTFWLMVIRITTQLSHTVTNNFVIYRFRKVKRVWLSEAAAAVPAAPAALAAPAAPAASLQQQHSPWRPGKLPFGAGGHPASNSPLCFFLLILSSALINRG